MDFSTKMRYPVGMIAPTSSALFSRVGGRRPDFSHKFRDMRAMSDAAHSLLTRLGGPERAQIVQLWRNWDMVMGPDIGPLAIPLGSRKRILLIGGEDNMAMQELTYQVPDILERVNAFMDSEHFERVELHLLLGRAALNLHRLNGQPVPRASRPLPPKPEHLGSLRDTLDPDSPIGRCYAAYLRLYDM